MERFLVCAALSIVCRMPGPLALRRAWASLLFVLCVAGVDAQIPEPLPTPDLDLKVAGNVLVAVVQPDGGVVFGGNFSAVNGVSRPSIARLQPDGSLDPQWNPAANGTVSALAVDAAGDIYVGGNFTFVGGAARNRIALLQRIHDEDMLVAGMHIHFPGFGWLLRDGDGWRIATEQWAFEI